MSARRAIARRAIAFHEAGHAVIACRLGLGVANVTIKRDGKVHGSASTEEAQGKEGEVAIVCYAGLAAERLVRPRATPWHGAMADYDRAAELVPSVKSQEELAQEAASLVVQHRAAIEAVAAALLEHETLPEPESMFIVDCVDEGLDWRVELRRSREKQALLRAQIVLRETAKTRRARQ